MRQILWLWARREAPIGLLGRRPGSTGKARPHDLMDRALEDTALTRFFPSVHAYDLTRIRAGGPESSHLRNVGANMPECQLDDCGISCEFGCSCMSDAAGCECWCENISLPLSLKKLRVREAKDPEAYVNFSASGMPLVRLAELFDDLFPGQILMPVSKMQEKVTTDGELRQIKLGDLVEYLGLVPVRTPLPGRATPPTDAEV
jgi:hypothetical protein